ncbi:MAG TPA: holo-ACP synthase [Candidatus Eisenbacteria bacterium]|nr:holo-ACP synthase [Candidatus Eisenbacteria bacterium]
MASVGVDIVEVRRIAEAILRWGDKFVERIYTPGEIDYCLRRARQAESFAVRFAAKEAFAKALKVGKASIWREVEVVRSEGPRPAFQLHGTARSLVGHRKVDLSLSHAQAYAVAVVLVED